MRQYELSYIGLANLPPVNMRRAQQMSRFVFHNSARFRTSFLSRFLSILTKPCIVVLCRSTRIFSKRKTASKTPFSGRQRERTEEKRRAKPGTAIWQPPGLGFHVRCGGDMCWMMMPPCTRWYYLCSTRRRQWGKGCDQWPSREQRSCAEPSSRKPALHATVTSSPMS